MGKMIQGAKQFLKKKLFERVFLNCYKSRTLMRTVSYSPFNLYFTNTYTCIEYSEYPALFVVL